MLFFIGGGNTQRAYMVTCSKSIFEQKRRKNSIIPLMGGKRLT